MNNLKEEQMGETVQDESSQTETPNDAEVPSAIDRIQTEAKYYVKDCGMLDQVKCLMCGDIIPFDSGKNDTIIEHLSTFHSIKADDLAHTLSKCFERSQMKLRKQCLILLNVYVQERVWAFLF
jgi:uncharacterized pyridoxal phosphate-containing UPF0001 family protein